GGDQKVGATDVGVEDRLEARDALFDGNGAGEGGRVVHDDVDASALLHQRLHRVQVRQVHLDETGVLADPRRAAREPDSDPPARPKSAGPATRAHRPYRATELTDGRPPFAPP